RPPRRPLPPAPAPWPPGGGRLRAGGRAVLVPHHRSRAGQELHPVARHHRAAHAPAVGGGRGAARRRRSLAAPRGGRVRDGLARGGGREQGGGDERVTAPALRLIDVEKSFGPTAVIMGVSLDVTTGSRHAIIGPNGAGKTTLFNLVSGRFPLSAGRIELHGRRIDGLDPHEITRRGLSRSFQVTSIFARMSVFENIRCGLLWSRGYRYSFWHLLGRERALNEAAERLLADVNLEA